MHYEMVNDRLVRVTHKEQLLFEYIYRPDAPALESPKPYFHPLKTLGGVTVTDYRPADHPWHHGLAMTMAHLSGMNFWGGPTYVAGQGYVQLENNGRIEHDIWMEQDSNREGVHLREALKWVTPTGELWLEESRSISARLLPDLPQAWVLNTMSVFINQSDQDREFGSPTTQGRPQAGYGGLFWRGHPSFLNGKVRTENGEGETALMGQKAPWLLYENGEASLLFVDIYSNERTGRYPTQWFVRTSEYAGVSFAFMFDTPFILPPVSLEEHQGVAAFFYRIALIDGTLTETQLSELIRDLSE